MFVSAWIGQCSPRKLEEGRSIESIARELGRPPSTVAYWVNKHGLTSQHARRHAARGGIERDELEALLDEGPVDSRDGGATRRVVHDGSPLAPASRADDAAGRRLAETAPARAAGAETTEAHCPVHGVTTFVRRGADGVPLPAVPDRARCTGVGASVKRVLVDEAGGACVLCGYDRSLAGLHFHHLDPAEKSFALSRQGVTRSMARLAPKPAKCVLLCSNCHAEVEAGDCATAARRYYYEGPVARRRPSGVAQSAEHSAVNRRVVGSSPTPRASKGPRRSDAGLFRTRTLDLPEKWLKTSRGAFNHGRREMRKPIFAAALVVAAVMAVPSLAGAQGSPPPASSFEKVILDDYPGRADEPGGAARRAGAAHDARG